MIKTDCIRKAVELANGDHWELLNDWLGEGSSRMEEYKGENPGIYPLEIDALAAQLVRQVDALDRYTFASDEDGWASVWDEKPSAFRRVTIVDDSSYDRTMNTIKAIVDSGILE